MWPEPECSPCDGHLHNAGYPMSRQHSETVQSNFFAGGSKAAFSSYVRLGIPEQADLDQWLQQELRKAGFASLEAADQQLSRPLERALVYDRTEGRNRHPQSPADNIPAALVLARCNKHFYQPHGPLILTRKRLMREVMLVTININRYYDLD